MAANPQYVGTPKSPSVAIATANPNRDGATGTYATLMTAGASGSRIDKISIKATATTTAGMVRLFVGAALIREFPVMPVTPSGTLPTWAQEYIFDGGLVLAAGVAVKVSTQNAEAFNVTVLNGGDF